MTTRNIGPVTVPDQVRDHRRPSAPPQKRMGDFAAVQPFDSAIHRFTKMAEEKIERQAAKEDRMARIEWAGRLADLVGLRTRPAARINFR